MKTRVGKKEHGLKFDKIRGTYHLSLHLDAFGSHAYIHNLLAAINRACHRRMSLKEAVHLPASSAGWIDPRGQSHGHPFHRSCASEQKLQEINFMISSTKTFDLYFFKSYQGDVLGSPILGFITRTIW
jgi:hypothetical protein